MKIGERAVARNVYLNEKRGYGDFHGKLIEYFPMYGVWEIRDDFHNTRWYPEDKLESE